LTNQDVELKETQRTEIISLMDNSIDFISTIRKEEVQQVQRWVKERRDEKWVAEHFRLPLAEHGLSMLIRVHNDEGVCSVLFDAGLSPEGVVTNAKRMGLNLSEVDSIVLSHGHYDHCGGLITISRVIGKAVPIIVHEDMFKIRGTAYSNGTVRKHLEFPSAEQVKPAEYVKTSQPYLLAGDTILVTGEIPRTTSFEKGFPRQRVLIDGKWHPDPWVRDDRAVVLNVKHKGLVVISGCAHAGIINTVLYAQQITGATKIYAVIGGFHLAGKECESRIGPTVEELKQLKPSIVAPSHCTGWRGILAIAEALPEAFVWSSVGNLYRF